MSDVPILWPWQGSKARLADWIAERLPPHRAYVEPFAGTAAVLLTKQPAPIEVLNDFNGDIVAVYRCLQDTGLTRRLYRRLRWTPISRAEWNRAHEPVADDIVEQAARFLVSMWQGFNGKPSASTWGGGLGDGIEPRIRRFLERLQVVADRLSGVALEHNDWQTVVTRYERPDTLIYLDPPYLMDHDRNAYGCGYWTETEQQRLIDWALQTPAMVMISGYDHPLMQQLVEAGWHRELRRLPVNVLGRTEQSGRIQGLRTEDYRVENLWWSPHAWSHANRQLTVFDFLRA